MTCYCKADMCNDRNFKRQNFRKWQKATEALFEVVFSIEPFNSVLHIISYLTGYKKSFTMYFVQARVSSITWKLFDWVPEIFFYSVVIGAIVIILKLLTKLPQLSSSKKR